MNNNIQNFNGPNIKPKVTPVKTQTDLINKHPIKKNEKNKDKKKRVLLLLLILAFIVIAGASLLVYFLIKPSEEINLQLSISTKVNGEIVGPGTEISNKKFVPGDEIPLELNFKISNTSIFGNSNAKVFARYKISAYVDDTYVAGLFDPQPVQGNTLNVSKGADNYFYYNEVFQASNNEIVAFRALDFVAEYNNNILNGKTIEISIELEILEANYYAIKDVWNTAPNEWRNLIKSQANS